MGSPALPPPGSVPSETRQAYFYFGPLTLLIYLVLPHGWLLDIVTSYMLKNQLHATATQVSLFRLFTALPVYFLFSSDSPAISGIPSACAIAGSFFCSLP